MQEFQLETIGPSGDCAVLKVTGEVDVYTAPMLRERIQDLAAKGVVHIIADMSQMDFLDSTGLGVLVGGLKRLREHDGSLTPVISTACNGPVEILDGGRVGVAAAIRFSSEGEALRLANDTAFGLAAGIWTRDLQRAHRMARGIRAGTVWVNSYRAVGPMAPFGGFKASGLGRENGLEALQQYTELKTVWIELDGATRDPFNLA